jgi:hypothetical protein
MIGVSLYLTPIGEWHIEAVEKVPKKIFRRDVEKNDLTDFAKINDLMLGKGQVTSEYIVLTGQKDFF